MIDFSYLKPGPEVYSIKHDPYYIKHGEGNKHVRKLFYNQEYDAYEEQKITEFENYIETHNVQLPADWTRELTLKYCYSGGFDMTKCLQRLQKHLEWRNDKTFQEMTPESEEFMKSGYIYQFGRDHQFRPVVYIMLHVVGKLKLNVTTLLNAATQIGNIVVKNMYVKGLVENWIVIVDIGGSGLFEFPFSTISMINDILSINFTSSLHKMFILNPSFLFNASWKLIEKIIHPETASKINFIKPSEYYKMQELIPAEEIEQKYGGLHQNLTTFWPIINTRPAQPTDEIQFCRPPTLSKRQASAKESEYYSIENNSKEFFTNSKMKDYRIHEQFLELDKVQSSKSSCCSCYIM